MPHGYGLIPYGLGSYGEGAGVTTMTVVSAVAVTRRQVQVKFSEPMLAVSGFGVVDALNPRKWVVVRLDTGAELHVGAVRKIDDTTVELYLLEPLGNFLTRHTVTVNDVESAGGGPIGTPFTINFPGIADSARVGPRPDRPQPIDLLATPKGSDFFGTTLVVDAGGDYDTEQGLELLRKLIIRRLTTPHGGFAHLPDYGVGFTQPKQTVSPADLRRLKADLERQVEQEPEVKNASVTLTIDKSAGILTGLVSVATFDGRRLDVKLPSPTDVVL